MLIPRLNLETTPLCSFLDNFYKAKQKMLIRVKINGLAPLYKTTIFTLQEVGAFKPPPLNKNGNISTF